jgi:hypothetical protein
MRNAHRPASLPAHWFQILLALADRDLHGLGVMNDVLERTEGQMRLWPGKASSSRSSVRTAPRRPAGSPGFFGLRRPGVAPALRKRSGSPRSSKSRGRRSC